MIYIRYSLAAAMSLYMLINKQMLSKQNQVWIENARKKLTKATLWATWIFPHILLVNNELKQYNDSTLQEGFSST